MDSIEGTLGLRMARAAMVTPEHLRQVLVAIDPAEAPLIAALGKEQWRPTQMGKERLAWIYDKVGVVIDLKPGEWSVVDARSAEDLPLPSMQDGSSQQQSDGASAG